MDPVYVFWMMSIGDEEQTRIADLEDYDLEDFPADVRQAIVDAIAAGHYNKACRLYLQQTLTEDALVTEWRDIMSGKHDEDAVPNA